jgi:hypothetical protein
MKIPCICEKPACGKLFFAKKADRARGWARFCSKSCAAWDREKKLDRGNYAGRKMDLYPGEFANAHQFSNEEHDCNKS